MPKQKQPSWEGTPLGQVAKETESQPPQKGKDDGPIVFEGLHRPEDDDERPNYPAKGIWR